MSERFVGKVVIVTGAGSGIGRATALAFAREGARVALADVSRAKVETVAAEAGDARVVALQGDVSQAADCQRLVRETESLLGPLDVLVNNAGVGASGTVLTTDEATWDRLVAVNLKGTYLMSRAALQVMVP
ncbi:MAG: SDR family NAD(P)-dependent oxidoreductase, partial [Betaproteobacteria bacterium]